VYIIIIVNGVQHVRHAHLHCAKASRFFDSFGHGNSMQGPQRTPSAIRQGEKLKLGPFLSEKKRIALNAQDIGWIWMVHSTTMYNPIPISSINRTFEHCACVQRPHSHPACAGICATWRHWTRPPGWDRGCKKAFQYFPIRTTGIENRPGYTGVYWKPQICVSRSTSSNLRDFWTYWDVLKVA
jgi:hypothetical protein